MIDRILSFYFIFFHLTVDSIILFYFFNVTASYLIYFICFFEKYIK